MTEPLPALSKTTQQEYLRHDFQRLSEAFADMAKMNFSHPRHRRRALENIGTIAGNLPGLAIALAFALEATTPDASLEEVDG